MSAASLKVSFAVRLLAVAAISAGVFGCGVSTLTLSDEQLAANAPFVKVSRGALSADGGPEGVVNNGGENFYLAINKSELSQRWFLSAYLTQWHPSENVPMRSLGTRVVTFKLQNDKLFVFDATDGKAWSDTLDPSVLVESYPIVTDYAPFNALPSSGNYVLFDPSAGLNRFSVVSDDFAASYWARFEVELSFLQNYRALADGVSFEQVFTGYTEVPGPGILEYEQPFRGSGTLSFTLRRYSDTPGFSSTELATNQYFGSSNWQYLKNQQGLKRYAVKWNIYPGMQPIPWRISDGVQALVNDPRLAGVDVVGAIQRGVEGWNTAFGFPAFKVVPTAPTDLLGDDDKNFIVVDPNPSAGYAFANWRENPNTGEIRGASVYFSSVFVESALQQVPAAAPCSPKVVISQVFGGNSGTGIFNQDFIELHNRSDVAVSLEGWSVQYASASGSTWQVAPLSGTIAPGGFFLVGLATVAGGVALPATDGSGGINLSSITGKVALVSSTTALSGTCPAEGGLVDLVGYGTSPSCSEGTAAPALNSSLSLQRRDTAAPAACTDTQDNGSDFVTGAPAPRNSGSPAAACACSASAVTTGNGTTQRIAPPSQDNKVGRLAWDAMASDSTCELRNTLSDTAIPGGMTRPQYLEAVITHTILHEVGHTLGLRHNFKGSLQGSSVMDYLKEDDGALLQTPGAYDVDAVKYLYGLSTAAPSQPFCTDHQRASDASCDLWDIGAAPLTDDIGPRFTSRVNGFIAGTGGLSYRDLWRVTRYVRAPASEQQRLEAFNVLMGQVAPPLPSSVSGLAPDAAVYADFLGVIFLSNLFLDPAEYRDEIGVDPTLYDPTFRARVIGVTRDILVNSDGVRGFESRRTAVDVLKAMQDPNAYDALIGARATLITERAGVTGSQQALIDDVIKRIDAACSPYFR